jgi:hypothetical protein
MQICVIFSLRYEILLSLKKFNKFLYLYSEHWLDDGFKSNLFNGQFLMFIRMTSGVNEDTIDPQIRTRKGHYLNVLLITDDEILM